MASSSALFYQGTQPTNGGVGVVFGDGLRCVSGAVTRLKILINAGGISQYPGPSDPTISVRRSVIVPGTRHDQVWYRNAAPSFCSPSTFNLTNGVTVTWGL
jgi:hypothetical protein